MPDQVTRLTRPSTSDSNEVRELKRDLLHAYHILDADGQSSGIAGHLTARLPGRHTFWSHRWGLAFDEVTMDDLIDADFELATTTADGRANPTLNIHTPIYENRPPAGRIIHT